MKILKWANTKVGSAIVPMCSSCHPIRGWRDPSLSSGLFMLNLVHVLSNDVIDWDQVLAEDSSMPSWKLLNAQYALSAARKLGADVFATPHDFVEVVPQILLIFVGSLMIMSFK